MTKVQVWAKATVTIDIPDDCEIIGEATFSGAAWETAANEQPNHGRMYFSVRIREKWQWPAWLNGEAIAMEPSGAWFCYGDIPTQESDHWHVGEWYAVIHSKAFRFTPPPCTDWRKSLRLNPNREAKP